MRRWGGLSRAWSILRELDINAIRQQSEQPCSIACFGQPDLFDSLARLLTTDMYVEPSAPESGEPRAPPDMLSFHPLEPNDAASDRADSGAANAQSADMLLLVLDGRAPLSPAAVDGLIALHERTLPLLVVVLHSDGLPDALPDDLLTPLLASQIVAIAEPDGPDAPELLAAALLNRLPGELHLAAARRLPMLRVPVAHHLITSTAFSNGTYALVASLSEQFPMLRMPFVSADMLVLTKNQLLLVYKLALIHGAPPEFQAYLREVVAVLVAAYLWREAARSLIGRLPPVRMLPRAAISYAATYTIGLAAWQWFAYDGLPSVEQLRQFGQQALEQAHSGGQQATEHLRRALRAPEP